MEPTIPIEVTKHFGDIAHECGELRAEVERHHRDFARVSEIVNRVLIAPQSAEQMCAAMREIRGIVG